MADPNVPEGWLKLSYSSMNIYNSCPLRWRYSYVDKLPSPQEAQRPLVFGNALHEALAKFYQQDGDRTADRLQALWQIEHHKAYRVDGFNLFSPGVETEDFSEGRRQLTSIWERYSNEGRLNLPTRVELRFHWPIDCSKVIFKGFIDFLQRKDNENELLDYKTGKWQYRQAEVDDNKQLTSYFAYCLSRGVEIARVGIYMTKHDQVLWSTRNEQQAIGFIAEVDETAEKIRAEQFDAKPSMETCRWCPYTSLCPEVHHKYRPKVKLEE
jgi:RecB family exonuclease